MQKSTRTPNSAKVVHRAAFFLIPNRYRGWPFVSIMLTHISSGGGTSPRATGSPSRRHWPVTGFRPRWQPHSAISGGRSGGWSRLGAVSGGEVWFALRRPSSTPARPHKQGNVPVPAKDAKQREQERHGGSRRQQGREVRQAGFGGHAVISCATQIQFAPLVCDCRLLIRRQEPGIS